MENTLSSFRLGGSSFSRSSSTTEEKRPCSPSVSSNYNNSRNVPQARTEGPEYLASCAYQGPASGSSSSATNNSTTSYQSRDSVVPNTKFENSTKFESKPFDTPTNSHSGKLAAIFGVLKEILLYQIVLLSFMSDYRIC